MNKKKSKEDNNGNIIIIGGEKVNNKEKSKKKGKNDKSVIVKIPLEGEKIEKMNFSMNKEAWVWLGNQIWLNSRKD